MNFKFLCITSDSFPLIDNLNADKSAIFLFFFIRVPKNVLKGSNEDLLVVFFCAQSVSLHLPANLMPRRRSANKSNM